MVRKRGGATGQGQGGSKRTATSPPIGATYKDSRRNIRGDEDFDDDEEQWTQVSRNKPKESNQARQDDNQSTILEQLNKATAERSAAEMSGQQHKKGSIVDILNERASQRGSKAGSVIEMINKKKSRAVGLGENSLFKTPEPEGCMRDVLTVEVQTKDRDNYRGTVTYKEAKYEVFMGALDLPEDILHGIKIQFGSGPTITYKLTEQIDIDTLASVEYFEFERKTSQNGEERSEFFGCQIKGLRRRRPELHQIEEEEEPSEPNVFDVTVSGCDYCIDEEEVRKWLGLYGETFGLLSENTYKEDFPTAKPTGNGTYTIKMRLDRPIPQFLPMYGKKVRIDHRSQHIMCTNCYGKHPRKVCKSEKVGWMDYVVSFMRTNQDVTNDMIGRWYDIAKKERMIPQPGKQVEKEVPKQANVEAEKTKQRRGKENSQNRRHMDQEQTGSKAHKAPDRDTTIPKRPDFKTKDKMELIKALREERADYERLSELTELGLSVEAARDLVANEKEIAAVNGMLNEKKKSEQHHERSGVAGQKERNYEW
jgi:hypothetical protein